MKRLEDDIFPLLLKNSVGEGQMIDKLRKSSVGLIDEAITQESVQRVINMQEEKSEREKLLENTKR